MYDIVFELQQKQVFDKCRNRAKTMKAKDLIKKSVSIEEMHKLIEEANNRGEFKTFLPHFVNINNNIMLQLMDEGFKVYYGEWGANMGSCLIIEW